MIEFVRRKYRKADFYIKGAANYLTPNALYRARRSSFLRALDRYDREEIADRVEYYLKGDGPIEPTERAIRLRELTFDRSFYAFDLIRILGYLPTDFRFDHLFGDVVHVPPHYAFVKSRPISRENERSVLLKLNQLRHYLKLRDSRPYRVKKDLVVWRGCGSQPHRAAFLQSHFDNPLCDIGKVGGGPDDPLARMIKPRMTIAEQLEYKFVLSIEGNDVATNLKWILQSASLCMMTPPKYETWFMEGRLQPHVHYVPLKNDYSDLEEKVAYYLERPDEAQEVIRNANEYAANFFNEPKERLLSLLVALKYAFLSGQYEGPPPLDWRVGDR